MTKSIDVLRKSATWGFIWPVLIAPLMWPFVASGKDYVVLLGSIPGFVVCFATQDDQLCNWTTAAYIIPSLLLIFSPYFFYLIVRRENRPLGIIASLYSLLCSLLGSLAILGRHI